MPAATARRDGLAPLPQTYQEPAGGSPHRAADAVFRRSQALWGGPGSSLAPLRSSRSTAALDKLERPTVQVAEPRGDADGSGSRQRRRGAGPVHRAFAAVERLTGFNRNQVSLGLQARAGWLLCRAPGVLPLDAPCSLSV